MTERQIEADETPCPLTRGEWLALLTAESQTVHGYMNLAVMVISMFYAILVAVLIYAASYHEDFNSFLTLIYLVIFAAAICSIYKLVTWVSKEEYKNSETIKEIISGELTDSDEIRRQYYKRKYYKRRSPCNMRNLF